MKGIGIIVKFFVATILIGVMIIIGILQIAQKTILSKEYIFCMMEESNYYANLYSISNSNFKKYIYQSGLPEAVLDDIITLEQIQSDVKIIILNVYEGKKEVTSTEILSNKIYQNIEENIEMNIQDLDESTRINIATFVETLVNEYSKTLTDYTQVEGISKTITMAMDVVERAINVLWIVLAVGLAVMIIFSMKKLYTYISALSIVFMTAGISYVAVYILKYQFIDISKISVINDAVTILGRNVINDIMTKLLIYGIGMLTIGIVSAMVSVAMENNANAKPKKKENKIYEKLL